LLPLAIRSYCNLIAQRNYKWALKLLYSLTSLQLFLDRELTGIFTLETLEDLDRYIAGTGIWCDICLKQHNDITVYYLCKGGFVFISLQLAC